MNRRSSSLARAALLLAACLPCAWSQTAQPIPLHSPKPKPPEKPKHIALEPPKPLDTTQQPTEIEAAPPPKPKSGAPAQPKDIVTDARPPEAPIKSFAPEPILDKALEQQFRALAAASHTKLALYAWQLNTSNAVAIDADQPIQTPEIIHLALFWETLRQVALGNARWDERLGTTTLREAASRMILVGDTTIPTLLVNHFTLKRVDRDLDTLGYGGQWLKPTSGSTLKPATGSATPRQMVRLLQHIGMCDLDLPKQLHVNAARAEAACQVATNILRDHLYLSTTPSADAPPLPHAFLLAAKTGPIAVAAFPLTSEGSNINQVLQTILTAWSSQGMDATLLAKPHLGVSWE